MLVGAVREREKSLLVGVVRDRETRSLLVGAIRERAKCVSGCS